MTETEAYEVAFHEAAHCIMCIMKNCYVSHIEIYDPPRGNSLGVCCFDLAENWRDNVWICLAGPIAQSILTGESESYHFAFGGSSDFDRAEKAICDWLLPAVPADLVSVIGQDPLTYLDAAWGDWEPPVRGQQKRKLTIYTKKLMSAHELALEILHREASLVREFLTQTPGILEGIKFLAGHLAEKRRLETAEILDLLHHAWNVPRHQMAA